MSALLIDAVISNGDVHVVDTFYSTRRKKWAKKVGDGVLIRIRIEPSDEAATWGDHKHLHGHLLEPTSEFTGYSVTELKSDMKARFLPDGMTSTTEMNHEQFHEFNRSVEQCIREEYPSECWEKCAAAMALSDYRRG